MKSLTLILRLLAFWLLFFVLQQLCFVAVNLNHYQGNWTAIFKSLATGLPMNIATATYLMALPVLVCIGGCFGLPARFVDRFIRWETLVLIVICSFLLATDLGLFKVWGTKTNAKALAYLQFPEEVLPTLFSVQNLGLFVLIAAQSVAGIWLFYKLMVPFEAPNWKPIYRIGTSLVLLGLCVLGFRGGFQKVPINRNWVFQSEFPLLNYGALNSFWNTADLLMHPLELQQNPYVFFKNEEAQALVSLMHQPANTTDSTTLLLTSTKPNIVIVFLESWAADVTGCLGGEKGVAPQFDKLAQEGLLFTRFYSTGYRTEQGYLAALSATPALPVGSVIQSFGKFDKLPNLYRNFNNLGYHTSFYTGGRLFFDNIEAYLRAAGVQTMKGENEWTINKRTVWGAYDEETFQMHLNELNQTQQPFFSVMTTMTTHEWFDADVPKVFSGDADIVNDQYRNTIHYSDSCLYAYLEAVKSQPWYANTLFIVLADHACAFPKARNNFDVERHHIPMLFTGGALNNNWKGKTWNRVASHTDIPAILLTQLKQPSTNFPYSKNVMNPASQSFAYYAFDNGFGMIADSNSVIYDHNRKMMLNNQPNAAQKQLEDFGKAYLQQQFQENIEYATRKHKH
jgi:phosphoglycerol transferase MdoB-like AlkP superfamily enzyme